MQNEYEREDLIKAQWLHDHGYRLDVDVYKLAEMLYNRRMEKSEKSDASKSNNL